VDQFKGSRHPYRPTQVLDSVADITPFVEEWYDEGSEPVVDFAD